MCSCNLLTCSSCTWVREAPPSTLLTCVWDETLQVGPGPLVLQQLLGRHVCEEHLEDSLSIQTVPGVGVPHHAEPQERLWWSKAKRQANSSILPEQIWSQLWFFSFLNLFVLRNINPVWKLPFWSTRSFSKVFSSSSQRSSPLRIARSKNNKNLCLTSLSNYWLFYNPAWHLNLHSCLF